MLIKSWGWITGGESIPFILNEYYFDVTVTVKLTLNCVGKLSKLHCKLVIFAILLHENKSLSIAKSKLFVWY